jgi:hypothetical protein
MNSESLWGDLPLTETSLVTPATILNEQAVILKERTNNVLVSRVYVVGKSPLIELDMDIIAPALDGYRYTLLKVGHPIMLYPLTMSDPTREKVFQCDNEDEFRQGLKDILSSPEVHKVILALLSQSKPLAPDIGVLPSAARK